MSSKQGSIHGQIIYLLYIYIYALLLCSVSWITLRGEFGAERSDVNDDSDSNRKEANKQKERTRLERRKKKKNSQVACSGNRGPTRRMATWVFCKRSHELVGGAFMTFYFQFGSSSISSISLTH